MSLENVMRLVQQMTVEERIQCASLVLGGRVRHIVHSEGDIKFFVHGYEYAKFPDTYEIIVGNDHYYGESFDKVSTQAILCYLGERTDIVDFTKHIWHVVKFEPVDWLTYPRWNSQTWNSEVK